MVTAQGEQSSEVSSWLDNCIFNDPSTQIIEVILRSFVHIIASLYQFDLDTVDALSLYSFGM